jgi:D-xylose transport system ATP-binding protein
MQTNTSPVLEVHHVGKRFGAVDALVDASISLYSGQIHALVGGNGAGKSTLVNILSGNHRPSKGEVRIDGQAVRLTSPKVSRSYGIATVYQNLALVNCLDVSSNVFLGREELMPPPLSWFGFLNNRKMRKKTAEELERLRVNIPDIDSNVSNMSGGQRQCIACARALMGGARVLMMDEPTAALGVRETAQVMQMMTNCRDEGAAIMLISHNMEDVFRLADRITVLRLGSSLLTVDKKDVTPDEIVGLITGGLSVETWQERHPDVVLAN